MKNILVTGGNRGIGLGICKALTAAGHTVWMGTRDVEKGEDAAKDLTGDVRVIELDVSDANSVIACSKKIEELDVLINNAGIISNNTEATEVNLEDVKKVMETNFYGAWRMIQAVLPLLKKSKDARIINMSSGMGALDDLVGGHAAYRLSKNALNGLTIQLANELSGSVKVNAMCPGWVRTDMGGSSAHRSVEEGADTALWLATTEKIPTGKFFRSRKEIPW